MRSVAEHRAAAVALVDTRSGGAPRIESLPLSTARGRILAADVVARVDVPGFDNSAMDGYAVRCVEAAAGAVLPVSLDVPAGASPGVLAPGTAARIMTGAPVPAGADAIVPREQTDDGLDRVRIDVAPATFAHIRRVGEDCREGDVVLAAGTLLGPPQLAAAAGAGRGSVAVAARPRVVVVSTGDELRSPDADLAPGQIYDSNSTLIAELVASAGGVVVASHRVGDDPAGLLAVLEGLPGCDLVITAGGVSVGAFDVVKEALADRGVEFVKVAIQPGKPQGLGRLGGVAIACLPGNPVSVAVSFAAFVEPMIRGLLGLSPRSTEPAVAGASWGSPAGREQWTPVVVRGQRVWPASAGGSRSHLGLTLARAAGWAIAAPAVDRVEEGDTVNLMRFLP